MIHLGDITKINGAEIPKVDVITGGSPCQDLSVAGKRAGLDGERSGLFMEQIRIIKEMREDDRRTGRADEFVRPRFMVWENVPGALSSGKPKGEDFRIVLEETARVADQTATVPRPKDGKWSNSGTILGDGFSISWRVHDAQFWGVPQRRRRISLVADFNGHRSAEILFERKSVSRDFEKSKGTWERVAESAERSVGNTSKPTGIDLYNQALTGDVSKTLNSARTDSDHVPCVAIGVPLGFKAESTYLYDDVDTTVCNGTRPGFTCGVIIENHGTDSRIKIHEDGVFETLTKRMGTGGKNTPLVFGISPYSSNAMKSSNPHSGVYVADTTRTLDNNGGNPACNQGGMVVLEENGSRPSHKGDGYSESDTMYTLNSTEVHAVCVGGKTSFGFLPQNGAKAHDKVGALNCMHDQQAVLTYKPSVGALCMGDYKGPSRQYVDQDKLQISGSIVRRLTPLECERLQGFPDGWTDIGEWIDSKGKKRKDADSPRYKALGNSIALPFWEWLAKRICAEYDRPITMGSLFDGIGGFPLTFERTGAKAVWASEIEEFCIAVTKLRFPEGDELSEQNDKLHSTP